MCSKVLHTLYFACLSSGSMDSPRVSQPSDYSRWKQWRRSPNTCCSKKILLLLMWQMLFYSAYAALAMLPHTNITVLYISMFGLCFLAPLIGWVADVKFGRYKVIVFASITSFLASIFYYVAMITGGGNSTLSNVFLSITVLIVSFGSTCYKAAMLPFLTDQIIGATSEELSAVVRWYVWTKYISLGLSDVVSHFLTTSTEIEIIEMAYVGSTISLAILLAMIIISDCLCQQWLDRTHKVTNPIKLIIQVLNYTRKHRYPERRSAFTYIDEEQPSRMDYGKEKFGGPFTEEEVEDVKTVLRLLPFVICLMFNGSVLIDGPTLYILNGDDVQVWVSKHIITDWLFPVLLIPLYQLLLYRFFRSCSPNMLRCIGAGLFMCILCHFLFIGMEVVGLIVSNDVQRYLSCIGLPHNATRPDHYVEWYWMLDPYIFYGIGRTIIDVLLFEFIIAQSPDKMKGFVIGISIACGGIESIISIWYIQLTLCYDLLISLVLVVLFVVFLVLSKRYTLRERNREINIQAIVEEHYERYMDQEEEYMRQPHY